MRGLAASARDALDRRLLRDSPRPIAVALSGGGDSLALTLIADAWAREHGRELLILTVDHRLQPQSAIWTEACAALAERLGRPFRALAWEGEKPTTGLPAAARAARHALLADAAREAGARVILMGHTRDDLAESHAMRAQGSTLPDAREWVPSPAWPEGRGVFLLRPLLRVGREDLRTWLTARGETWIDDPANTDLRFARSRARATTPGFVRAEVFAEIRPTLPIAAAGARSSWTGPRCAPRRRRLRTGWSRPRASAPAAATGCRPARGWPAPWRRSSPTRTSSRPSPAPGSRPAVTACASGEPGEAARGGLRPLELPVGREVVWDGRFALTADAPGLVVRPTRDGNPAIDGPDAAHEAKAPDVTFTPLVLDRFRAAAGLIVREPA